MAWQAIIPIVTSIIGRNNQGIQKLTNGWNTAQQLNKAFKTKN